MEFIKKNWLYGLLLLVAVVIIFERLVNVNPKIERLGTIADSLVIIQGQLEDYKMADSLSNIRIVELSQALSSVRTRRTQPIVIDENLSDIDLAFELDTLLQPWRLLPTSSQDQ